MKKKMPVEKGEALIASAKKRQKKRGKLKAAGSAVSVMTTVMTAALADSMWWSASNWGHSDVGAILVTLLAIALGAGSLYLAYSAYGDRKVRIRFENYAALLSQEPDLTMEALSRAVGVPQERVRKDFQSLLDSGYLSGCYFSQDGERFVIPGLERGPVASLKDVFAPLMRPAKVAPAKEEAEAPKEAEPEDLGREWSAQIKALGKKIQNEQVTSQIVRIERVTAHIFSAVQDKPGGKQQISTFLGYYLPTTLKILTAYARYEEQRIQGNNVKSAVADIEGILEKLADGFERQLDRLYADEVLDISAEIEALEAMLAKDGLSGGMMGMAGAAQG